MIEKLTTLTQIALLHVGDILQKFPVNCDDVSQDIFDESRTKHISRYEIRYINQLNGMFSLVTANSRTQMLAAPVDIGRLFIRSFDLITEKLWWIKA